jgi:hypothetical protein
MARAGDADAAAVAASIGALVELGFLVGGEQRVDAASALSMAVIWPVKVPMVVDG